MVGIEAHLRKMEALLDLDYDGVKMVGISGPAGIGKTTIARALKSILSDRFQLTCFLENLREHYHSGLDEYGLKLRLQGKLLSNILNQDGMRISHLGVLQERLRDLKVLIIIDDVDDIKQLEALADETKWFGPGSRIIITTEDQDILERHGINFAYHVGFPSNEEAREIFSRYTFRQSSPPDGFEKLAKRVIELCSNLPLGLRVMGSSLRGKKEDEWEVILHRLENSLDKDIERVLRVGYESLDESEQMLFLHIAVFFNYKDVGHVRAMLADADENLDVKAGLEILISRSLIRTTVNGEIVMHRLLQQVGTKAIQRQEPWKRQILIDAHGICDVLENDTGTRTMSGISFDTSGINEVAISKRSLRRMPNLRFLKVYRRRTDGNDRVHIPLEMEFPHRLRLLHWDSYPMKCLPPTFHPHYLVELHMKYSQLEKLWSGTQPLTSLRKMDLSGSHHLKELPDLSKAINLETLKLSLCVSLVEIPSSCSHLGKVVQKSWRSNCVNLQAIPPHLSLTSLEYIFMRGFSKLKNIPVISTHIRKPDSNISSNANAEEVEEVPASVVLRTTGLSYPRRESGMHTHLHTSVTEVALRYTDVAENPYSIKEALQGLTQLDLLSCRSLQKLRELPGSLTFLCAEDYQSLDIVSRPFDIPDTMLGLSNSFTLGRRGMIPQSLFLNGSALLPGSELPEVFDHRARGNCLTIRSTRNIPFSASSRFKICLVVSPNDHQVKENRTPKLLCRTKAKGGLRLPVEDNVYAIPRFRTEHLFVFYTDFLREDYMEDREVSSSSELVFEFSSIFHDFDVIECGAQIWTKPSMGGERSYELEQVQIADEMYESEDETNIGGECTTYEENLEVDKHTYCCWSWLFLYFDLRNIKSLVSGRRR